MTIPAARHNVNFMRPLIFAALCIASVAPPATGQRVPGRDLLGYSLGAAAEAPALATETGDGVWNPATIALPSDTRARLSAAALAGPPTQELGAQLLSAAVAFPRGVTLGLSVIRASVGGLIRTETDPQSIGPEIPYNTTLVSAQVAQRSGANVLAGVAVRYRMGQLERTRGSALSIDAGLLARGLTRRDVRVGLSTFLFELTDQASQATINAAADMRALGADTLSEGRLGYSFTFIEQSSSEHYVVGTARVGKFSTRLGLARTVAFGQGEWRPRLAVGLHYARYLVAVAREDNGGGLDPTYQFTLSAAIK